MDQIHSYFPELTSQQIDQFNQLNDLYAFWNEKINVISRKDIDQLYERHILHSLAITKIIQFKPGTSIMDVGTGGGFPGIPLAIMFPETRFHLVDSIGKKITVVNEVAKSIELKNVTSEHNRAEKVKDSFDFVVSRAVTAFPKFVNLVRSKIKGENNNELTNGIIYLKGGDFEDEIKGYQKVSVYEISEFFPHEFFETKKIIHLPIKNKK